MSLSTGRDKGFIDVFTETDVLLLEIHRYMPLHIIHIIICNVRIKVSIYTSSYIQDIQGVAKRLVNFESLELTYFQEFYCCFCALLTVKYGQFITLDLFPHGNDFFFLKN